MGRDDAGVLIVAVGHLIVATDGGLWLVVMGVPGCVRWCVETAWRGDKVRG